MSMLNVQKMEVVKGDNGYEAISFALSQRERDTRITDVRQFFNRTRLLGLKLSVGEGGVKKNPDMSRKISQLQYEDCLRYFKNLQKTGAGALVEGRGEKPTRFHWNYRLSSVVSAIEDGEDTARALPQSKKRSHYASPKPKTEMVVGSNKAFIQVRDNFIIPLTLPSDFNKTDAQKIGQALLQIVEGR